MKFFTRKEKVTPKEMASEILEILVQAMQQDIDEANQFDKENAIDESRIDFDKKSAVKEFPYIYTMLIIIQVASSFPKKSEEILREFHGILVNNEMEYYWEGSKEYGKIYNEALKKSQAAEDDSSWSNPLFSLCMHASIKSFGTEEGGGLDIRRVIRFNPYIMSFAKMIADFFKQYKVI